jgi:hypothetical protein
MGGSTDVALRREVVFDRLFDVGAVNSLPVGGLL